MFSCLTKLAKLLCLKCRGSRSRANSAFFHTTKLQEGAGGGGLPDVRQAAPQDELARPALQPHGRPLPAQTVLGAVSVGSKCHFPRHLFPSAVQEMILSVSGSHTRSYLRWEPGTPQVTCLRAASSTPETAQ